MPDQNPTLQEVLLRKAESIGAPQVGTRYLPFDSEHPVMKAIHALMGAGRPASVAAQDPFGIDAWEKKAGPMPMPFMGETKALSPLEGQLYSRAGRAVSQLPEQANAARMKNLISKAPGGVAPEELQWRGVDKLLESKGQQPISRQEIQQHLQDNPLDVKTFSSWVPHTPSFGDRINSFPPNYDQYTLPGGENYRETLLQLKSRPTDPRYGGGHYDVPNVVAHTRHTERTLPTTVEGTPGSRGRFLEEVQSDWHQKGKETGYDTTTLPKGYNLEKTETGNYRVMGPNGMWVQEGLTPEDATRTALEQINRGRVPDAPFKESWPDLALKQQLLETAKDPKLDWMGFTTGQQQADRYNLAKHISELVYHPSPSGGLGVLDAFDHEGNRVMGETVAAEDLPDHIGKELAQKLLSTPTSLKGVATDRGWTPAGVHHLQGLDLQTGGEGMKHFYDNLLPARLNKILKPFGGQVEKGQVSGTEHAYSEAEKPFEAWIARLTPEMKQRIAKEGLPLLSALYAAWSQHGNTNAGQQHTGSSAPTTGQ